MSKKWPKKGIRQSALIFASGIIHLVRLRCTCRMADVLPGCV
ncbi:MAG: hypothetical protein R8L58_08235 [Mariprofundaceae bacterium]